MDARFDVVQVRINVSCRKLKENEIFRKSHPFVEAFERTSHGNWLKVGQTEVVWGNLNPDFIKFFEIDYYFEEQKYLQFQVFDAQVSHNLEVKGLHIGECSCILAELLGAEGQQLIRTLLHPGDNKPAGSLIIRAEKLSQHCNDNISIQFHARNLDIPSWFSLRRIKPMFTLHRISESGLSQIVYSSEVAKGSSVSWNLIEAKMQDLCNGSISTLMRMEIFNNHSKTKSDLIGFVEFRLSQIVEEWQKEFQIQPTRPNNAAKPLGFIIISPVEIQKIHSFLDYISGGCKINLLIAIDFTASNLHPRNPKSLHYLNPEGHNQYESALFSIADILLHYSTSRDVLLYGFGGKIHRALSHCFPLNFNPDNPRVTGLPEIMSTYREALEKIEFSGPTLFSHIISTAIEHAEAAELSQRNQQYFILLILTDGDIHDIRETIDLIVKGSHSPLSIVIVGIGSEDFSNMELLDSDEAELVDTKGRRMIRDIVQFVPYKDFSYSPTALVKEVLAEIPREIVNFFNMKNIIPGLASVPPEFDFDRTNSLSTAETAQRH